MPLPLYFVPDAAAPPEGRIAACGWYALPDGSLHRPEDVVAADALVFDDRDSLPAKADELLREAERIGAAHIVLDFERPFSEEAAQLVKALAARFPTAAPCAFCTGSDAIPICCYAPTEETFSQFLARLSGWVELRPIADTVLYPIAPIEAPSSSPALFSPELKCFYTAETQADGLCLHLSDTRESFQERFRLLTPHATAAIVLQSEWSAFS